ncbi:hypothetical protein ACHAQJ_004368 [Trichoderma viride]
MAPREPKRGHEAQPPGNKAPRKSRKNKDRSDIDDESIRDEAAKIAKDKRRSEIMLDYARFYNGREIELPLDEDFTGFSAVPRKGYYVRLRQLREQVNSHDERVLPQSFKAPPPWVPDPYDDCIPAQPYWGQDEGSKEDDDSGHRSSSSRSDQRPNKRMCRRSNIPPRTLRYYKQFYPLSQEFVLPEDESEEEELPEHIIRKTPPTFMGIPREIRLKIYRYLLLTKKAIAVHGGWKQVYRNNNLSLSTGILGACKIVHEEACVILYGENVFLYRLRDPIFSQEGILRLATDDDLPTDDESESGSEYEDDDDDGYDDDDDERSLFCSSQKESCINIVKYAHLFRKIAVEAEHNRYSKNTLESMAAAISIFAKQSEETLGNDACNIHTLTIRVSPLWHEEEDQPGQGRFTFIDFFEAHAPVISAIKAIDCQVLHVDILTRYMSRQSSNSAITLSENGSVRLTVDRRNERFCNMILQGRAHQGSLDERDKVMQHRMVEMARRSAKVIDELAMHIETQCKERNFHQETPMDLAFD